MSLPIDVTPHIGFTKTKFGRTRVVKFGMTRDQVLQALGEPTFMSVGKYVADCEDEQWRYQDDLDLTFDAEDELRLATIDVLNSRYHLNGQALVGLTEPKLLELKASGLLADLTLDETYEELDAKHFDCDSLGVRIWVSRGRVSSVAFFSYS